MNILAIGDFHGKFPENLKEEAKKADLILCTGDFANADKIRKLIFKYWMGKNWYEVVGLKKAKQLEKESFDSGLKILKELNKLNKKVYVVFGNSDFYKERASGLNDPILIPGFYEDKIKKLNKISLVDNKKLSIKYFDILGFGGYVDSTEYIKNPIDKDKEDQIIRLERYLYDKLKLKKLFLKKGKNKDFILLAHYPPYGVMDKILFKKSPMNGKHIGWEPYNKIIKKYNPKLVLCGHMHEYQGKKNLGKSLIVNPGPAGEGKAAVIEWPSLKIRFIR